MKIAVCSDLHLEFGPIVLENKDNVEVLILSGDIFVNHDLMDHDDPMPSYKSKQIHEFFYNCCNVFPHVVYVAGNHEHYHGDFATTLKEIKRKLKYLPNLQVLDKDVWDYKEEYRFIGGTLWTDMNKEDPITLSHIKGVMNDFRTITNSNHVVNFKDDEGKFHTRPARFTPEDAVEDHRKMVDYLNLMYSETPPWMKVIVVGHHAPSKASTHPRYRGETIVNGAYSSDLSEFILDRPGIKLWTHGHTHEDFDYMIGDCRVVCNPRGYDGYERRAAFFELKVIDV
jgi:predicted phosphodiesterase